VTQLVPDPVIAESKPESLFIRLLEQTATVGVEEGHGLSGGFLRSSNALLKAPGVLADSIVSLSLDLEQVYYGPPRDIDSELFKRTLIGALASIGEGPDPVVGVVQWRGRLQLTSGAVIEVIGEGGFNGRLHMLGRRAAIEKCNRRALENLLNHVSEDFARHFKIKRRQNFVNESDYVGQIDGKP
jgi:hypothetical protein